MVVSCYRSILHVPGIRSRGLSAPGHRQSRAIPGPARSKVPLFWIQQEFSTGNRNQSLPLLSSLTTPNACTPLSCRLAHRQSFHGECLGRYSRVGAPMFLCPAKCAIAGHVFSLRWCRVEFCVEAIAWTTHVQQCKQVASHDGARPAHDKESRQVL